MKMLCLLSPIFLYGSFFLHAVAVESAGELDVEETAPYAVDDPMQMNCLGKSDKPRFQVTDISWPAQVGDAEICLWKNDKYAAVSITIDDNSSPDHDWWLEQCKKHDFRVTWFVITDGVTATAKDAGYKGSWEGWRALQAAGHSVQSHTISHHVDISVLEESVARQEYGGSQHAMIAHMSKNDGKEGAKSDYACLTAAYPCGKAQPAIAAEYFIACRGTTGTPNRAGDINYRDTNGGHLSKDFIRAVLGEQTVTTKWLSNPQYKRGWITPLYHLVGWGKTPAIQESSRAAVAEQIAYMIERRDKLWIETFVNVAKYGQERDSATLTTLTTTSNDEKIMLSLTDTMRDDLFDYPLSIKVKVPSTWTTATATQNGEKMPLVMVEHDDAVYVVCDMRPDVGELTIESIK